MKHEYNNYIDGRHKNMRFGDSPMMMSWMECIEKIKWIKKTTFKRMKMKNNLLFDICLINETFFCHILM
jgi:hypothetical protein